MDNRSATEIQVVSGAISIDTAYGASLGSAGGFLAMGIAAASMITPIGLGVMLGASIFSSGTAIYYASE